MGFTAVLPNPTTINPLKSSIHHPKPSKNTNSSIYFPTFPPKKLRLPRLVAASAAAAAVGPTHCLSASIQCCLGLEPERSPATRREYGAYRTVTLERPQAEVESRTATRTVPELATGGGGDSGNKKIHGGNGGGDDGSDDDDYFEEFDEGDEGDEGGLFGRRFILQELFDRKFLDAVLQEWFKTVTDLPAGLRQACEMGLVSSAELVRFLAVDARPTVSRAIYRSLLQSWSRAFIGRMIADPSFIYQLILEQATTIGCSIWWELKNRKERVKQEWDLALINILTATACNAIVVWSLAPCRSYGNTFRFDLQNSIQKLPNNIFEKSYPLRGFDLQKRVHSFFYKAAELSLVGMIAGAVQSALLKSLSAKKEERSSVAVPSVCTNALGYGAFLGLYSNLRCQLLCGINRAMFDHFDVLGVVVAFRTALRILTAHIGERHRLAWLGVESDPQLQSDYLVTAYKRNSEAAADGPPSNWFLSKDKIISGLGLLGIRKGYGECEATSKTRRKRVSKRKLRTSPA